MDVLHIRAKTTSEDEQRCSGSTEGRGSPLHLSAALEAQNESGVRCKTMALQSGSSYLQETSVLPKLGCRFGQVSTLLFQRVKVDRGT